ncbi:hypothetical protein [Agriterribacter humi]|uniref:hypothetical protein n=1 Tax=Agriterribacter humi TaxID=1104781 RepID=UPI0012657CC3|nr:hypothetical protein [Agriterribacter humi]
MTGCDNASKKTSIVNPELKEESIEALRTVMRTQSEWVKVHAAEFLIWTGNAPGVKQAFLKELELFHEKPQYRIGIWRVLAQLSDSAEAAQYKKQIVNAFLDTAGRDRIHAIETMAKLEMSPLPDYPFETQDALKSSIKSLAAYAYWAIAYTNTDSMQSAKKYFLGRLLDANEDILQQRIAAYVLRNSGNLEMEDWDILQDRALALPAGAEAEISFLNAALLTAPPEAKTGETYKKIFGRLLAFSSKKDKGVRMDIAAGLVVAGGEQHLPLLTGWMRNTDPTGVAADDADVQASAAYAILKISGRMNNKN